MGGGTPTLRRESLPPPTPAQPHGTNHTLETTTGRGDTHYMAPPNCKYIYTYGGLEGGWSPILGGVKLRWIPVPLPSLLGTPLYRLFWGGRGVTSGCPLPNWAQTLRPLLGCWGVGGGHRVTPLGVLSPPFFLCPPHHGTTTPLLLWNKACGDSPCALCFGGVIYTWGGNLYLAGGNFTPWRGILPS